MAEEDKDEIPPEVYFCPECVRPFTDVKEKLEHLKEEHPDHEVTEEDSLPEM